MTVPIIVMDDSANVLNDTPIGEVLVAAIALLAIVVILWRVAVWLNRRGHAPPPIRAIDLHIQNVEKQAADRRAKAESYNLSKSDLPDDR